MESLRVAGQNSQQAEMSRQSPQASFRPVGAYQNRVLKTWDDVNGMRRFWESVQWHPESDFEFYQIVLQSRSDICSPCVFVVSQGLEQVALLIGRIEESKMPVKLGYARILEIPARKLVIMTGGFMGRRTSEVLSQLLVFIQDFAQKSQLDLIWLENTRMDSLEHAVAKDVFGPQRLSPYSHTAAHWLMKVPKSWDDFMLLRTSKRRNALKRLPKVLDRDFPGDWSIVRYRTKAEVRAFAEAAEKVASKTYHRGLGVGFRCDEENLRRLEWAARGDQFRGYVLLIKGEPKAFWDCFQFGTTLYTGPTGYDPAYANHRLGTVLLLTMIQDICGGGIEQIDFGLGDAEYKQNFGTEHFSEATLMVYSKTAKGHLLKGLHSLTLFVNRSARMLLDKLQLTQRLKTIWRRAKQGTNTDVQPESSSE